MEKLCKRCLLLKPVSEYYVDKKAADRLMYKCKSCTKSMNREWAQKNPQRIKELGRLDREKNKEKKRVQIEAWKAKNKVRLSEKAKQRYASFTAEQKEKAKLSNIKHSKTEKRKIYLKAYSKTDKRRAYVKHAIAKRRAQKSKATPSWINLDAIKSVYKRCPQGLVVDHIVPLKGINVCGLHVHWNLQYLTPEENLRKGNKLEWPLKES